MSKLKPEHRRALFWILRMVCQPEQDHVWRVHFCEDHVECKYIGFRSIDSDDMITYSTIKAAPEWMQDAVAVLNMLPPTAVDSTVFGLGRRIDADTFWVVQPMETIGVNDPRSESEASCDGSP